MAEGARLESVYTATYRGFESLPHRHLQKSRIRKNAAFCYLTKIESIAYLRGYGEDTKMPSKLLGIFIIRESRLCFAFLRAKDLGNHNNGNSNQVSCKDDFQPLWHG